MREHRKMTLKRIGIGILCMVFVLSMLAPLVAFAEEKTESGSQVSKRELAYIQISVGDGQETPVFRAEGIRVSDQCKKQRKCRRAQRADRTGYQECIRLAL